MPDAKVAAIRAFMSSLIEYRRAVKDDAALMLARLDMATLSDATALEEFLTELVAALASKHLVSEAGNVRPQATKMIRAYVAGMERREWPEC